MYIGPEEDFNEGFALIVHDVIVFSTKQSQVNQSCRE